MDELSRSPGRGANGFDGSREPHRARRHWPGRGPRATLDASRVDAGCRCANPFEEPEDGREAVVLDVRDLPLQGQIGRTLAALDALPAGHRLRHVNTVVPWPLFALLEIRGFRYRLVGRETGNVHVLIWPLAREEERTRGAPRAATADDPTEPTGPAAVTAPPLDLVDREGDESFPCSDPPSWTLGPSEASPQSSGTPHRVRRLSLDEATRPGLRSRRPAPRPRTRFS